MSRTNDEAIKSIEEAESLLTELIDKIGLSNNVEVAMIAVDIRWKLLDAKDHINGVEP